MNKRVALHAGLFVYAILISQTLSILPFILPIAALSLVGAARNKNPNFDVIDIFWLLFQLSFVLSPARSFGEGVDDSLFSQGVTVEYWMGTSITYPQSSLIYLFLVLTVVCVINLAILPTSQRANTKDIKLKLSLTFLLCILYASFLADISLRGGLGNVLAARHARDQDSLSIFAIFSSSLFLASLWLAALKIRDLPILKRIFFIIVLIAPAITLYNPFNAARFAIIQAWLPIILIFLPNLRRFSVFAGAISFGLLVLMPILSLTTRYGIDSDVSTVEITPTGFLDFLDQHTVALHLIHMVDRDGYQFGTSIISVIGFFIPRAIWPDKPIVVGLEVGNELYQGGFVGTQNLSGPIFLDYYYDFGIVGVIIGSIITAMLFRRLLRASRTVNSVPVVEYIILAAIPILFRGSVGAVIGVSLFSFIFFYVLLSVVGRIKWGMR